MLSPQARLSTSELSSALNQLPDRKPSCLTPFTRRFSVCPWRRPPHAASWDYDRLTSQPQPARRVKSETNMAKRQSKGNPTWEELKAELASFDRAALLAVL